MTNKIIEKDFHFATFKIEHLIKFLCQKNPKIQIPKKNYLKKKKKNLSKPMWQGTNNSTN